MNQEMTEEKIAQQRAIRKWIALQQVSNEKYKKLHRKGLLDRRFKARTCLPGPTGEEIENRELEKEMNLEYDGQIVVVTSSSEEEMEKRELEKAIWIARQKKAHVRYKNLRRGGLMERRNNARNEN